MDATDVMNFLTAQGLAPAGAAPGITVLSGGVSADIVRIDLPGSSLCIKRALPELKVAARWTADIRRSNHEVEWLRVAARIVPTHVPEVLAADQQSGTFAMPWLDPVRYPVWKSQLLAGEVSSRTASEVGRIIGAVHAATANDTSLAVQFEHDEDFAALRLDPYLTATADRSPLIRAPLLALRDRTARTRRALVHGDVSPKNILVGAAGPILLDAECAWFGDTAFDAAFCLNHLLLKGLVVPGRVRELQEAFLGFCAAYADQATFEPWADLEARISSLLPALMLARVDGVSPVEYLLNDPAARQCVRDFATPRVQTSPLSLATLVTEWSSHLTARPNKSQTMEVDRR